MRAFGFFLRVLAVIWTLYGIFIIVMGMEGVATVNRSSAALVVSGLVNLALAFGAWKWSSSIFSNTQARSDAEP